MGQPVRELSRDEIVRCLEQVARERLGMSAIDMIEAYRGGTLKDPGIVGDVLTLALLLKEDDPLFAGGQPSLPPR